MNVWFGRSRSIGEGDEKMVDGRRRLDDGGSLYALRLR